MRSIIEECSRFHTAAKKLNEKEQDPIQLIGAVNAECEKYWAKVTVTLENFRSADEGGLNASLAVANVLILCNEMLRVRSTLQTLEAEPDLGTPDKIRKLIKDTIDPMQGLIETCELFSRFDQYNCALSQAEHSNMLWHVVGYIAAEQFVEENTNWKVELSSLIYFSNEDALKRLYTDRVKSLLNKKGILHLIERQRRVD